jgi:hypothetical protein
MEKFPASLKRVRALLIFFMFGLVLSGLSAIPLQWEVGIIKPLFGTSSWFGNFFPAFSFWMDHVCEGVQKGYGQ